MDVSSFLLVTITAVQMATTEGINCTGTNRFGKALGMNAKSVLPPAGCQQNYQQKQRGWCEEPGADYPWDDIQDYLRRSNDAVKQKVNVIKREDLEKILNKYSLMQNDLHFTSHPWRKRRSARLRHDVTGKRPISEQRDNVTTRRIDGSAEKEASLDEGNSDFSGDMPEFLDDNDDVFETDTVSTSADDISNLELLKLSPDGSGHSDKTSEKTTKTADIKDNFTDEEELAILYSYFTDPTGLLVTKELFEKILQLRDTLKKVDEETDLLTNAETSTETAHETLAETTETVDETATPQTRTTPEPTTSPYVYPDVESRTSAPDNEHESLISEVQYYNPTRPRATSTPAPERTSTDTDPDAIPSIDWDYDDDDQYGIATAPHAEFLVARPPSVSEFKRKTTMFPAREPVTSSRPTRRTTTPPSVSRRTTSGPHLEDVTETVYATPIYVKDEKVEFTRVPAKTNTRRTSTAKPTRTTRPPTTRPTTTEDPYIMPACRAIIENLSPFYAVNTQGIWKTLINLPHYETYVYMEHCDAEREQGRCAANCRCTQRYMERTMPVYERDVNGCDTMYMDKFRFPSHCDCMCLPNPYSVFSVSKHRPTTRAPERVTSAPKTTAEKRRPTRPSADGDNEESIKASAELAAGDGSSRKPTARPTAATHGGVTREPLQPTPVVSRATLVPPRTQQPVPPRVPILPSNAPVLNHRNLNRGPTFLQQRRPLQRYLPTNATARDARTLQLPIAVPR